MTQPDMLLYNGIIRTMDPAQPRADAIALRRDRVLALGSRQEVTSLLDDRAQALDLHGSAVIPGLIDSHIHLLSYSLGLSRIDLHEVPTLQEAQRRVASRMAQARPGEWIRGAGWNCNLWGDGSFPHRGDLDAVSPANPAALSSKDGHAVWINSRAIEMAHITAQTPDPPGGRIRRDPSGEPTGILLENATDLIYDLIPPPSLEEAVAACKRGLASLHRVGLTGVHDCEDELALRALQALRQRGDLSLRITMHIPADHLDAAIALGLRDGLGDEWVRVYGVKAFADGALGPRSAWMLSPFETDPTNTGIPTLEPEALHELVHKANSAGLSVAVHAIGDAANRAVLDAIAAAPQPPMRNRIEHVQLLHPADVPRLAQLGVIASMQPIHATSDMRIADLHWGKRSATSYAWRSLLDAGTHLAFGSDAPVEDPSPLQGIHAAVTRRRPDGSPGPQGWYPEQRITATEAVYAYTMGAAYASGEEMQKGSLTPGKLADLVVLDRDILITDPMDILHTRVLGTMIGGEFVYRNAAL